MKKMKFAVVFIFILICMTFIGESFQDLIGSFSSAYSHISIEKSQNQSEPKIISDIIFNAEQNNVSFFTQKTTSTGMSDSKTDIYYSDLEILNDLKRRFNITEETYRSLFLGDTAISFIPFSEIKNIEEINDLGILGAEPDIKSFEKAIYKYTGDKPNIGEASSASSDSLILLWSITAIAILFTTVYELLLKKKETYIKIAYGEKPINIILKNIVYDTVIFSALFCLSFVIVSQITYCEYLIKKSIIIFAVILFLNALIYLSIYRSNIKIAFSSVHMSNKLLIFNYGVKVVTMVLTVCIISSNIALISEGFSYLKQKSFYEQHENYSFLRTLENGKSENGKTSQLLNFEFYEDCVKDSKVIAQSYMGGETGAIYINKNNEDYLEKNIDSLNPDDLADNKLYFIIPENLSEKEEKISNLKAFVQHFFRTDTLTENMFEIVTYGENVSMLAIENDSENLNSYYMKNPIIFFENLDGDAVGEFYGKTDKQFVRYGLENNLLFKADKEDFINFAADKEYDISKFHFNSANALDSFMQQAEKTNQIIYINTILSLIILLIEFIIISLIIKMEYTVNAVELTVKKLFGYGLLEKNKNIFLLTILTSVLGLATALTVNFFFELTHPTNILLGGLIIWAFEIPVITYNICKLEKAGIQKLLKGGLL